MKIKSIIIILLTLIIVSHGWIKRTVLDYKTHITNFIELGDSSLIIIASIDDSLMNNYCGVLKTNLYGDSILLKTYGSNVWFEPLDIVSGDSANLFYISGTCYTDTTIESKDLAVLCIDSNVDSVFFINYDFGQDDIGGSIARTPDGEFIIVGDGLDSTWLDSNIIMAKIKRNGSVSWMRRQNYPEGSFSIVGQDILIRPDGYFYTYAASIFSSSLSYMTWCILLSPEGDSISASLISDSCEVRSGTMLADSSIFFGGLQSWIAAIDTNYNLLWDRKYFYPYSVSISDLAIANDGNVVGCARCDYEWLRLMKFDSNSGDTIWTRDYDISIKWPLVINSVSNGDFIVVGSLDDSLNSGFIMRVDSLGNDIPTGITECNNISKPYIYYISAHPNPFNSAVRISVETQNLASLQIEIFDVNGRMVDNLSVGEGPRAFPLDGNSPNGSAQGHSPTNIVWQPDDNIGSGIYLVRATVGEQSISKRIVYLK